MNVYGLMSTLEKSRVRTLYRLIVSFRS